MSRRKLLTGGSTPGNGLQQGGLDSGQPEVAAAVAAAALVKNPLPLSLCSYCLFPRFAFSFVCVSVCV